MGAKFIINNRRYIEAYENTNNMDKPYVKTKKAIKNHSIIDKNYYIKAADKDNDGDRTNNAKIYSKKKKRNYYLVTNIIPKSDFTWTDPSTGTVYSGLYWYGDRNFGKRAGKSVGNGGQILTPNAFPQKNKDELTNIRPIGDASWAFAYLSYFTSLSGVETTWDTSEMTNTSYMFCRFSEYSFSNMLGANEDETNEIKIDFTNWDTRNLEYATEMFNQCFGLRRFKINPEKFTCEKLISTAGMFHGCVRLKEVDLFNTSNVKYIGSMFRECSSLESIPAFNFSKVEDMSKLFESARSLKRIAQMDTRNVKSFYKFLWGTSSSLTTIAELDTSSAINMSMMFFGCDKLPAEFPWVIDCSNMNPHDNTYGDTGLSVDTKGMSWIFTGSSVSKVRLINVKPEYRSLITSSYLKHIDSRDSYEVKTPLTIIFVEPEYHELTQSYYKISDVLPEKYNTMILLNVDTFDRNLTGITDTSEMFKDCSKLHKAPVINTANVSNLISMFENCENFDEVFPWTINLNSITDVQNLKDMFKNTPVTTVKFRCPNERIRQEITPQLLRGDNKDMNISYTDLRLIKSTNSSETMKDIYPDTYTTMQYIPDDIYVENINNTNSLFKDCSSLLYIPELDTTGITSSSQMLYNCSSINSVPLYNTSSVTNASYMFYGCSNLNSIPAFDFSNVTNVSYIFGNCSKIKQINIDSYNLNNLNSITGMFFGCTNLEEISGTLNIENVTNTGALFSQCSKLKSIPELNTSNVISMSNMFNYCSTITTIPEIDTNKVTDMNCMFSNCTSLISVPQLDTSNVTNMSSMFYDCKSLSSVPQMDTSKVTDFTNMFSGCTSLPNNFPWEIDISSITDIDKLKNMFNGCAVTKVVLKGINPSLDISKITPSLIFNNTSKQVILKEFEYSYPVTDSRHKMSDMYTNYQTMTSLPKPLANTNTLTDASKMFYGCKSLTAITTPEIYNFDNVKDASYMFGACSVITKIPKLKMDMIEDAQWMFANCSRLTTLDLSNIDFSNIKDTYSMFYWDENLSSLTMPDINSPYLIKTSQMFQYCKSLKIENIPYINTSKVTTMHRMFSNCTGLVGEFPYALDCSSITNKNALEYTFGFTSLTKVKLKNVPSNLKSSITKELLFGRSSSSYVIEFID